MHDNQWRDAPICVHLLTAPAITAFEAFALLGSQLPGEPGERYIMRLLILAAQEAAKEEAAAISSGDPYWYIIANTVQDVITYVRVLASFVYGYRVQDRVSRLPGCQHDTYRIATSTSTDKVWVVLTLLGDGRGEVWIAGWDKDYRDAVVDLIKAAEERMWLGPKLAARALLSVLQPREDDDGEE